MRLPAPLVLPLSLSLLLLLSSQHAAALKDGLDIQLFACNTLSVRQSWRHNATAGRLQLVWCPTPPAEF